MKLLVISNAPFILKNNFWHAYSPYVNEIEIWNKYAENTIFCCPIWSRENGLLISKINSEVAVIALKEFNKKSIINIFFSIVSILKNGVLICKAMKQSDHIHLRCPGNIGLLGCFIQIFFPNKIKTAKYAGNWDPKAKQPWSYRIQKWILSNTFLTKNIQVLVYGDWLNQSKNIKSFFTATYSESDKKEITPRAIKNTIQFVFVGTLSIGKRPLFAAEIIKKLSEIGVDAHLTFYGEGELRTQIENYIASNNLSKKIKLKGNQSKETIEIAYQQSHFVILPSKSEGWPKVIAEAMFWGCVPLATKISCVPNMLNYGKRGLVLEMDLEKDTTAINTLLLDQNQYQQMSLAGISWSRNYTLDRFEAEIKLLLHQ